MSRKETKEKRRKFSFLITVLAGASVRHIIRQLASHSLDPKYVVRVVLTVIVGVILEPFRWWESLRWARKIRNTRITEPPVFIIGFWRSGTTLLHSLLCQVPGVSYITTYQTVFPNLILSHSWWFKPIIGKFWPTHRPFDEMKLGLDFPQEEEIAMANLLDVSFYNFLYFPKDFEKFYEKELFMRNLPPAKIEAWKSEYQKMIKKAMINLGGNRFISKSPSNMARIRLILEMFPDAKFIFIYRDPYKSVESFYRFFHEVLVAVQVQESGNILSRTRLTRLYADMIRQYQVEKHLIPPENLIEIRFEEFSKNPLDGLKEIFTKFSLHSYPEAEPFFKSYLDEVSEFRQTSYEISDETIQGINENAGDLVEDYGYQRRAVANG